MLLKHVSGEEKNPKCGGHICCVSNLGQGTSFRGVVYYVAQSPFISDTSFDANIECHTMYATVFHPNYSDFSKKSHGIKLKWALPSNQTQSVLDLKRTIDFACSNNSNITIVQEVPGYYCSCQHGFDGDGYSQGLGCTGSMLGYKEKPSLHIINHIDSHLSDNGGVQLQDIIVKAVGKWESRLFTAQELKEATKNYADHMKLGMGGFGTVYKGVLSDGRLVAIKKANRAEGGNEQFLNELQILMHINHRNIVRLLGCCMETAMPCLFMSMCPTGLCVRTWMKVELSEEEEEKLGTSARFLCFLALSKVD
ncbi:hypothetical protein L7F22_030813 [Adiantum nelumboides]|nr:hypothetical protein [Adiantum nelumboides]